MSAYAPSDAPHALILCGDGRLARLLETELSYLGVPAKVRDTLPIPDDCSYCLLLADVDGFGETACRELAAAMACPLLLFGRVRLAVPPSPDSVFLRRPFALADLDRAVSTLLGHGAKNAPAGPASHNASARQPHVSPPLSLVLTEGAVTVGEHRVSLTPAEQAILAHLMAHRGQAVSRDTLATLLGGGGNSVDVYVCRLRAKIEKPLGRRMIVSVRGVGYRMDT